jgi:DNA-binding NarL/FixJ family response regulator
MTAEERLQKHSGVAFCLRAGKTNAEVAELEHVSVNTVRVVRRALVVQGEMIDR